MRQVIIKTIDSGVWDDCFLLEAADDTDIVSALRGAAEVAKKDGVDGYLSSIPDRYLKAQGLTRKRLPVIEMENEKLALTEMEKAGVSHACCRDCFRYEDGFCSKYGSGMDPKDEDVTDCIYGDGIYLLCYKDGNQNLFSRTLCIERPKDIGIPKILELLANEGDESLELLMAKDDYDPKKWLLKDLGDC